jgi:hypothetical protein
VLLFRSAWRVAEPNEALIISRMGAGAGPDGAHRVGVGKGTVVCPARPSAGRRSQSAGRRSRSPNA